MPHEFDRQFWEDRYRDHAAATLRPNPQLVAEVADLKPGHALDAGCGEGGDALWLAGRGWHVTAVDIAEAALDRARTHAASADAAAAARIDWIRADLTGWTPARGAFDLVTSHYVHAPGPQDQWLGRLADAVAPGGTLLVVGHDHAAEPHATDPSIPESRVTTDDLASVLDDDWDIVVAEPRTRTATGHGGHGMVLHDAVLRAVRKL